MSGFSSIANPGKIPTSGSGRTSISPETLFRNGDKSAYQNILDGVPNKISADVVVKKVKVEIFDLSDPEQVKKYEELWSELLRKAMKMEVVVDSRKDLVNRKDGTSYWMKYVEYVEFGDSADESGKDKSKSTTRKD